MSLGACRLKKRVLASAAAVCAALAAISCGSASNSKQTSSGLPDRVLASQSVTSATQIGGLYILDAYNDTIPRIAPISAGSSPGLIAVSPERNLAMAFDSASNSVYSVNTTTEQGIGRIQLPGLTQSMVIPTSAEVGYAAVPSASVSGYTFVGAVEQMNLAGAITTTIAVPSAQTVVANSDGSQMLVFSSDSDSLTVLNPLNAVPPVDLSCLPDSLNPSVCEIIPGFSRPVNAIVSGTTAYILNCGFECGGTQQASVAVFDLVSLSITNTIPVNGATIAYLSGSTLYVAGLGTPTGPTCASLTSSINPQTAATYCGTLDLVNLNTMTDPYYNNPSMEIAIPDGYHYVMDLSANAQLFVGSLKCQNIGDVGNPSGEVRGCLAIYNAETNALVIPPDNGDVNGLQSFTSRYVEYVAEGGNLRVYNTTNGLDVLLIDSYILEGTIDIVGYVNDVKAISFF
jgi:hypothetical protein